MINYVNLERGEKMTFQEDIEQLKNQESWIVAETENYVIADSRGRTDGLPKSLLIEFDNWADLAMALEELESTHPLETPLEWPECICHISDSENGRKLISFAWFNEDGEPGDRPIISEFGI